MSDKPIIAHSVIRYLPISENWIYTQIAGLSRYRPLLLTKKGENLNYFSVDHVDGVIVEAYTNSWQRVYQKLARRWAAGHYPAYIAALKRYPAVILHSHLAQHGYDDIDLARRFKLPHIVSTYGADIWKLGVTKEWQRKYQELFSVADCFLVEGNAMRQRMVDLGCSPHKIQVQHLGVDLNKIRYVPRKLPEDKTVRCLMAGRATEKKGMIYGLKAFANIAQRNSQIELTIMTWGESAYKKGLIASLRNMAQEQGVADRITWYGLQPYDEYIRITETSHIFMTPSIIAANGDAEGGCPVTAIELSAAGMPIVGFAHCDIPEVVLDGITGYLAPEKDIPALTRQLEHVVNQPDTWKRMGQAGRRHIETEYNADVQVRKLEEIYTQLIKAYRRTQ
ncbi:MAG: glycosyltransferase [Desulfobacteraceae bacterium]|nr:glycosyltransferase [Desulfobacteraceae bacterium]